MIARISRRDLLHAGCLTAGALGVSTLSGTLAPVGALAESKSASNSPNAEIPAPAATADAPVEMFYKDEYFGAPWIKPEPALLIHGNDEWSVIWNGWVPKMAQEFRTIRPDMPGFGNSAIPPGFEWTMANLATVLAHFLDSIGIESVHFIGAKTGGAIGMQFAADYPKRTRTLTIVSGPVTPVSSKIAFQAPSPTSQLKRLGTSAPKEQVEFWNAMMSSTKEETRLGIDKVEKALNMESVLPRITVPTLVITADQSGLQSLDTVIAYQRKIANSRLLVIPSDGYHVAAVKPDECVMNTMSFIKMTQRSAKTSA